MPAIPARYSLEASRPSMIAVMIAGALVSALEAEGQNLVIDGTFDTEVNFDVWGGLPGSLAWDSHDADARPASGSIAITNDSVTGFVDRVALQCIPGIAGFQIYDFGAKIRSAAMASNDVAQIFATWYSSNDCTSGPLSPVGSPVFPGTDLRWRPASAQAQEAPPGAASAQLTLSVFKMTTGGTAIAQFDDVVFGVTGTVLLGLFSDGWEQGTNCTWSNYGCS